MDEVSRLDTSGVFVMSLQDRFKKIWHQTDLNTILILTNHKVDLKETDTERFLWNTFTYINIEPIILHLTCH